MTARKTTVQMFLVLCRGRQHKRLQGLSYAKGGSRKSFRVCFMPRVAVVGGMIQSSWGRKGMLSQITSSFSDLEFHRILFIFWLRILQNIFHFLTQDFTEYFPFSDWGFYRILFIFWLRILQNIFHFSDLGFYRIFFYLSDLGFSRIFSYFSDLGFYRIILIFLT